MNKELNISSNFISLKDNPSKFVMMDWEDPLMKEHAKVVAQNGGNILEIGFGMGISANYIQTYDISSHTIIESNPQIIEKLKIWSQDKNNVIIVEGTWFDNIDKIKNNKYDGIFYDAYLDPNCLKFYELIVQPTLKSTGVYSYFNLSGRDGIGFGENFRKKLIKVDPPENDYCHDKEAYVTWVENGAPKIGKPEIRYETSGKISLKQDVTYSPLIKEKDDRFSENKIVFKNQNYRVENIGNKRVLFLNNLFQAGYDKNTVKHEKYLIEPMEMCKHDNIRVLSIGLGAGRIPARILEDTRVVNMDIIDFNPEVIDVLEFFETDFLLHDNRVNIIFEDVAEYVKNKREPYDFVFIDILNGGESALNVEMFNNLMYNMMNDDSIGVFAFFGIIDKSAEKYKQMLLKSFKNVSLHDTPRRLKGTYFFFSNKNEWNKNLIEI